MRSLRTLAAALLICGPAFGQSTAPKIAAPLGPTDAANRNYVDTAIAASRARIVTTYTAGGTLPVTDDWSVLNNTASATFTLAACPTGSTHDQRIVVSGAGGATISTVFANGNIGSGGTAAALPAQSQGAVVEAFCLGGSWWLR